jgi:hypothetical protein
MNKKISELTAVSTYDQATISMYVMLKNGIEDVKVFDPELATRMTVAVSEYEKQNENSRNNRRR